MGKLENHFEGGFFFAVVVKECAHLKDLIVAVKRGNHSSPKKNKQFLDNALLKEIKHGWIVWIVSVYALKIPGLELAPLGVASWK